MLHNLSFFSSNAVYFIMLSCLVPVLFAFYLQGVLKFKCKMHVANETFQLVTFLFCVRRVPSFNLYPES